MYSMHGGVCGVHILADRRLEVRSEEGQSDGCRGGQGVSMSVLGAAAWVGWPRLRYLAEYVNVQVQWQNHLSDTRFVVLERCDQVLCVFPVLQALKRRQKRL